MGANTDGFTRLAAKFERGAALAESAAEEEMAKIGPDLMALSQAVAPYLGGDLRDAAYWDVIPGPELVVGYEGPEGYLLVQHAGFWIDFQGYLGYKKIENYTTPNTGSHFLSGPFAENRDRYVDEIGHAAVRPLLEG